jgi:branched-chain amino acid transport system permease protein
MSPADRRVSPARCGVPLLVAFVGLAVGWGLSVGLPDYYVFLGTSAIVAAISLLGLGVVTGSAGMMALCQLSFAVIGAWVTSELNLVKAPGNGILWMIAGAIAAGLIGLLVGLPALRLRGVNLAVVTLGFAAAVGLAVNQYQFPGTAIGIQIVRPQPFFTDRSFFQLSVIVLVVAAAIVYALQVSRVGSGWRAVAFSERGTASAGASVRTTKLSAFAVSAALGGLSGGLVTLQVGFASASTFAPLQSLALYVLAIVSGSYLVDMAVFGGILWVAVPEILKRLGIPQDWSLVVFGVLGVQALTSRTNLGEIVRVAARRRRQVVVLEPAALDDEVPDPTPGAPVLIVLGLGVRFENVAALDGVDLTLRAGEIIGLIGPNGAGKSTMIDALSGFLPRHTGTITLDGRDLARVSPARRARLGLRRTFQQDRVPPSLTVEAYVRFVARRRVPRPELIDLLSFLGCPAPETRLAAVDVGTRRLVEVAAQLASRPRVLLLDEPAAGLSHEEHLALGERLARIPSRYGASVILIEHDLDLVRGVCRRILVLDFGKVLADGDRDAVLSDKAVLAAYMGETELL